MGDQSEGGVKGAGEDRKKEKIRGGSQYRAGCGGVVEPSDRAGADGLVTEGAKAFQEVEALAAALRLSPIHNGRC